MGQVSVFGSGSYGTALAIQLARTGLPTRLWGRNAEQIAQMRRHRVNERYLPDCPFPNLLGVTDDLDDAAKSSLWVLAVPSHSLGDLLEQLAPRRHPQVRLACASKGFEPNTGRLMHEVIADYFDESTAVAMVSGPTFARELAQGLPSAVTVGSKSGEFAAEVAQALQGQGMRTYTSTDLVGVAVGGGVKNVIAIAVGAADGLGLGANTRALLITRGMAEIMRLGAALGAQRETLMGLSGMGDLVLTCTDDQSRNRRFGRAVGRGADIAEAEAEIGQVVEGCRNAAEVHLLAEKHGVDMPISEHVYQVIHDRLPIREAVAALSSRPGGVEHR